MAQSDNGMHPTAFNVAAGRGFRPLPTPLPAISSTSYPASTAPDALTLPRPLHLRRPVKPVINQHININVRQPSVLQQDCQRGVY